MSARRFACSIAFVLVPLSASAQEPLRIERAQSPVRLDGRLDEEAWSRATPLPLVRLRPVAGGEPGMPSAVLLTYDDEYLYAAARFAGDQPGDVRSNSLTRDRLSGDNEFRLLLDTFNDAQNGLEFVVNPAGTRMDRAILNDGRSINQSWDAFWHAATSVDSTSWVAEVRIPFTSLRFQPQDGRVVMGVIASRYRAVTNELSTFPALPPGDAGPEWRALRAQDILLEGVQSRTPMYIAPYVVTGRQRLHALNATRDAWEAQADNTLEAGFDVKLSLSSNLTLDLTANTDFAQVEADNQQVNLSRFSLFFPEKRQFFQERSGLFDFNISAASPERLFHSRRIGIDADGTPLRIYGGARVVGRVGAWDLGALSMQTEAGTGDGTENMSVLRVRRTVLNPASYVGGMLTTRLSAGGPGNVVYAGDVQYRAFADDFLILSWAQSFDTRIDEAGTDAGMLLARWERRANRGLMYMANVKWQGPAFEPALGYITLRDFYNVGGNLRYGWLPQGGVFQQVQPSLLVSRAYDNGSNRLVQANATLFLNLSLKNGVFTFYNVSRSDDTLSVPLNLGNGVVVPAGRHHWLRVGGAWSAPQSWRVRPSIHGSVGGFYDGRRTDIGFTPSIALNQHVELGAEYFFTRVTFADRAQVLDADIARVRINAALNPRMSGAAFVQYNEAARQWAVNARLRWHAGEGRDLWIVVNDQLNTDLERDPRLALPRSQSNAVALKYTHTLIR